MPDPHPPRATSDRTRTLTLLGLLLTLGTPACLDALPDPSTVTSLRVLALSASPPTARPGDSVTLSALIVDPASPPTPATLAWFVCLAPEARSGFFAGGSSTATSGGSGGAPTPDPWEGSCRRRFERGDPHAWALPSATSTATWTVPTDLLDDATVRTAFGLPADLDLPAPLRDLLLGVAGVQLKATLVITTAERTIESNKRIQVTIPSALPNTEVNENPDHPTILIDPTDPSPPTGPSSPSGACFADPPPTLSANTRYHLVPTHLPDPQPRFAVLARTLDAEIPFTLTHEDEVSYFSWFTTHGTITKAVTKAPGLSAARWKLPADAAGPVDLWVVTRDGRGGTAWCHATLTVQAPLTP